MFNFSFDDAAWEAAKPGLLKAMIESYQETLYAVHEGTETEGARLILACVTADTPKDAAIGIFKRSFEIASQACPTDQVPDHWAAWEIFLGLMADHVLVNAMNCAQDAPEPQGSDQ